MNIQTIDAGHFKLDGGAMFGVVPKSIWHKLNPADDNNMCSWAMRCLLIENGKQLILIDTGMGDKQDARWQGFYYRHGNGNLEDSIKKAGYQLSEITDVILSHLHFDHCGGAVRWNTDRTKFELTFPNAKYWTHADHWALSQNPNPREKATFLKENLSPLQLSGQLYFTNEHPTHFGDAIEILTADGHTEKMLMPLVKYQDKKILFMADTIPSAGHIPLPYVMGYDTQPLKTMQEKDMILQRAVAENWLLMFDHDPQHDVCTVQETEKGIRLDNAGLLNEFIG